MRGMTSLTSIVFVYFVTDLAVALSLNRNLQTEIERVGHLTAWFCFFNSQIVGLTLAHAQMNYHVSHFDSRNQVNANMLQNCHTNHFSL